MHKEEIAKRFAELSKQHGEEKAATIPIATWNDLLNGEVEFEKAFNEIMNSHQRMRESLTRLLTNIKDNIGKDTVETSSGDQARYKLDIIRDEIDMILYNLGLPLKQR